MLNRAFPVLHEFAPEVFFGGERIVRRAAQREIRGTVIAARGKWFEVVKLEAMVLALALPVALALPLGFTHIHRFSGLVVRTRDRIIRALRRPKLGGVGALANASAENSVKANRCTRLSGTS